MGLGTTSDNVGMLAIGVNNAAGLAGQQQTSIIMQMESITEHLQELLL